MTYLPELGAPIAFAHRGGAALWPENTLAAVRGSLRLGYRYVETDVHMTADREVVLLHDTRVDRTTDGIGDVRAMSLRELKRLDAGDGERVPTLAEALAEHPELRLNLEIKQRHPDMTRPLHELLLRLDALDRVLVASANDDVGAGYRQIAGHRVATSPGPRGVLRFWVGARLRTCSAMTFPFDALQVPQTYDGLRVVDEAFVTAAHRHGIHVHVWTVDEPARMEELLALGVDGIMTDRPDVLAEVFDRHGLALDPHASATTSPVLRE